MFREFWYQLLCHLQSIILIIILVVTDRRACLKATRPFDPADAARPSFGGRHAVLFRLPITASRPRGATFAAPHQKTRRPFSCSFVSVTGPRPIHQTPNFFVPLHAPLRALRTNTRSCFPFVLFVRCVGIASSRFTGGRRAALHESLGDPICLCHSVVIDVIQLASSFLWEGAAFT